jgi:DNA-binding LacI/PurR family transcriptional regulator
VSDSNRRTVLTTLEILGYERPARIRTRKAGLVGVIVPELDNPVFPLFAQHIELTLARAGHTPVVCSQVQGGVHEDDYVQALLDAGAAGLVFVSGIHSNTDMDPSRYAALRERGVPIVLVNGYVPGLDAPFLSNDDATAVELAVQHLCELGHERIGLAVGPDRYLPAQRRIAAFRTALQTRLHPAPTLSAVEELIERSVFTVEGGDSATEALLAQGVTAVVYGSDVMALGGLRACRRLGVDVPGEVSLVGSDGVPFTEFTGPPLTTVRQPVAEMAEAAARALLDEIAGRPAPRAEYVFRPELVVRESTSAAVRPPTGRLSRKK